MVQLSCLDPLSFSCPLQLLENLSEHDEAFLDTGSYLSASAEGSQLAASNLGDTSTEVQIIDKSDKGPGLGLNQEAIDSRVPVETEASPPSRVTCVPRSVLECGWVEQPTPIRESVSSVKATSQLEGRNNGKAAERLSTASLGSLESFDLEPSEKQRRYSSANEDFRRPLHEKHDRKLKSERKSDQPLSSQKTELEQRLQEVRAQQTKEERQ